MKQLLLDLRADKPKLMDVPVPTPAWGTALVRTSTSLLSAGTERSLVDFAGKSLLGKARARPDLMRQVLEKTRREGLRNALDASLGRLAEPMPLGYSSAGTIVELGGGMEGFQVGQRVACAGGNYAVHAEFAVIPQNLLAPIPDHIDFEAAAFSTLGAIALHGFRIADVQLNGRVAVIGLGLLGQLAASIALAAGCQVLGVDLDPNRVKLAKKRGIDARLRKGTEKAAQSFTRKQGFDAVLICADTQSNDPVELAGEIARERAKVVVLGAVGMDVPRRSYYAKELNLSVSRSYGPGRYDPGYEEAGLDYPIGYVRWTEGRNLESFVDLLATNKVEISSLTSHRFPIEQGAKAYSLIQSDKPFLGVVITYPKNASAKKTVDFHPAPAKLKGKKIRLGVLGAGNFARNTMLPALRAIDGIEPIAIVSASGRAASDLGKRFGFAYATSDTERILKDKKVDAIAILTRHHLHAEQVLAALKAGKHVFCEKPLALNEKELSAIEKALAKKAAPMLTVGYNRRFAPLAIQLKEFMSETGEPFAAHYRINAGELPVEHWTRDPAQGGGRVIGEVCHFVDFLSYLADAAPKSVIAQSLPNDGASGSDSVQIQLQFPAGSIATISYLANGDRSLPKEQLEVFSGGRVASLNDFRSLEMTADGHTKRIRKGQDKGHHAVWRSFVQALQEGGESPIAYDQLISVSRTTFATALSLQTGEKLLLN
jgi:predicted dehydrogenase